LLLISLISIVISDNSEDRTGGIGGSWIIFLCI